MKYLLVPRLITLSETLSTLPLGPLKLTASLEAYSCKAAGNDKKLSKTLREQLISQSPVIESTAIRCDSLDSLESLNNNNAIPSSTIDLLISLISTLSHSMPDYDFTNLRPEMFEIVPLHQLKTELHSAFFSIIEKQYGPSLSSELWTAIDETVDLKNANTYRLIPSTDAELIQHKLDSAFIFFYNRQLKKIVLLHMSIQSLDQISDDDEERSPFSITESSSDEFSPTMRDPRPILDETIDEAEPPLKKKGRIKRQKSAKIEPGVEGKNPENMKKQRRKMKKILQIIEIDSNQSKTSSPTVNAVSRNSPTRPRPSLRDEQNKQKQRRLSRDAK